MKRIPVEKIEDGMILDKDVCGSSGSVLLGKGSSISVARGRRLKNWGIDIVFVEGEEETPVSGESERPSPQDIKASLEEKFAGAMSHPVMKRIFAAVYHYRLQQG